MPKSTVSSDSSNKFLKPFLVSLIVHPEVYTELIAEDPDIVFIHEGSTYGPWRFSSLAGLDPRARSAYDAFQFLHRAGAFGVLGRISQKSFLRGVIAPKSRSTLMAIESIGGDPKLGPLDWYDVIDVQYLASNSFWTYERPTVEVHCG